MTAWLRRLYGSDWDLAAPALRRAVATIFVGSAVTFAIAASAALSAGSVRSAVGGMLVLFVSVSIWVGLAVFLLRGSRVVWALFVLLGAVTAAVYVPEEPWHVLGYGFNALELVLLLAPSAVRAVWTARSPEDATGSAIERPH